MKFFHISDLHLGIKLRGRSLIEDQRHILKQIVERAAEENIDALMQSETLWKCLSCFACVERCPRDVKPGKLIDAARQMVVRQRGADYLKAEEIPELLDPELPQQLLVSAFRRYKR